MQHATIITKKTKKSRQTYASTKIKLPPHSYHSPKEQPTGNRSVAIMYKSLLSCQPRDVYILAV